MFIEQELNERRETTKQRLTALKEKGYQYICTHDDGATWVPADTDGLEIDHLLETSFIGNINLSEANS